MNYLGVTSTRRGMSEPQKLKAFSICHAMKFSVIEARHGDCVGGDEQFHEIFQALNFSIYIHPPKDERYRAFCEGAIKVYEPEEYLVRDRAIVRSSTLIISAPHTFEPLPRSGTWYTDKYARKTRRNLIRILPDGSVKVIRKKPNRFDPFLDFLEANA